MSVDAVSFESFCSRFATEKDCVLALYQAKWPNGFCCPRCRHPYAYVISTRRLPLYECQACKSQTSLISGTLMEGSRTQLRLWFQAIYLHTRPAGINALQLSRIIGVTYKTAWLICHKIRHAMSLTERDQLLSGIVSLSDAVYCDRPVPSLEWHKQEQPLIIGASGEPTGKVVRIKIKKQNKVPLKNRYDCPDQEIFIRENIDPTAQVRRIVKRRIGRQRNLALVRLCLDAESFLGHTFRGIGPKHLQVYLDQYCYIWNRHKQAVFSELLQACATTRTITYPQLTGSTLIRSSRPKRQYKVGSSLAG
ncbi:transposase [Cohnella kolymensis]|uniref:transposase n=1 Tax=Cohnella kolymensis TaxID=1590652 RepID=UPI0009E18E23|nr:transposase [Cohnella kolymensis]